MTTETCQAFLAKTQQAAQPCLLSDTPLYSDLTRRAQLVTIAALTGRGKSLLAQNCAVHAIQHGGYAAWINLDMPLEMVHDRLASIMTDSPPGPFGMPQLDEQGRQAMADLQQSGRWLAVEYSPAPGFSLEGVIDQAIIQQSDQTTIVVVDGFDRLRGDDFDEQCNRLAALAAARNICVMVTSQVVRDACDQEVVGVDDLAFTMGKSTASSLVVALGSRVRNKLLTCSIVKDRAGLFRDQQVFRLQMEPSLRLSVVEPVNAITMEPNHDNIEPQYVNCDEQDIEQAPDDDQDDADQHEAPHSGQKLYHGTTGFVGIGRGVFESAMYQERKFADLGCLLSLYEMAAFTNTQLYAPKTRIPVNITRGQIMTSHQILADHWGLEKKQVERFLARAEQEGLLRTQRVGPDGKVVPTNVPRNVPTPRALATVISLSHYDGNSGANEAFGSKNVPSDVASNDPMMSRPCPDAVATLSHY